MTAGWVLPREWDAGRLLRFLTGLALLALAFAANAGMIAAPALTAPATATTTVDVPAPVELAATAGLPAAVGEPAAAVAQVPAAGHAPVATPAQATQPAVTVAVVDIGPAMLAPAVAADPAGAAQGSHGSRAPPAV